MSMGSNILLEDVAKLRMQNKRLRDEVARLTKSLAWALKHVPKGGTGTYACNLAFAENALAAAITQQAGKGGGE